MCYWRLVFCLILRFCKSFLATSATQSQPFINLFLIKKVFLWPESWKPQALSFQEDILPTYCILECGDIAGCGLFSGLFLWRSEAVWHKLQVIQVFVLMQKLLLWMAAYCFYFNPQVECSFWNDGTVQFPSVTHKWIRWVWLCSATKYVKAYFSGAKKLADFYWNLSVEQNIIFPFRTVVSNIENKLRYLCLETDDFEAITKKQKYLQVLYFLQLFAASWLILPTETSLCSFCLVNSAELKLKHNMKCLFNQVTFFKLVRFLLSLRKNLQYFMISLKYIYQHW